MTKFANRFNSGKIDLALLPIPALEEEAKVWMKGEQKYGRDNWKKLWGDKTIDVVMASLLRHSFAILKGEERDEESGEYHASHIRCNAAMLIEYYNKKENPLENISGRTFNIEYKFTDLDGTLRYHTDSGDLNKLMNMLNSKDLTVLKINSKIVTEG